MQTTENRGRGSGERSPLKLKHF